MLITELTPGRTRATQWPCVAKEVEGQMTITRGLPYNKLPREQQRFVDISIRAEYIWLNNRSQSPLVNWQWAENQLCGENPEFRCARLLYGAIGEVTNTPLSEIKDADYLGSLIVGDGLALDASLHIARETGKSFFLDSNLRASTIGQVISWMIDQGF